MLTPKQEKFCHLYIELGVGADAYRQAYGSKAKPDTLYPKASKLLATDKISTRLAEIRGEMEKQFMWTKEQSIATLKDIATGVTEDSRPSDRVAAIKVINAMFGWDKPEEAKDDSGNQFTITVTRAAKGD